MKKSVVSHKSMLILVSSEIVDIWLHEIHQHYSDKFQIILYYEIIKLEDSTNSIWKKYMINFKNINKKLSELDFNNFKIKITIILSSYSIWYKQIYCWKEEEIFLADRWEKSKYASQTKDDSDDNSISLLNIFFKIHTIIRFSIKLFSEKKKILKYKLNFFSKKLNQQSDKYLMSNAFQANKILIEIF